MDELLLKSADQLTVPSALVIFIVLMLSKRIVPWWIYEEVLKERERMEHLLDRYQQRYGYLAEEPRKRKKTATMPRIYREMRRPQDRVRKARK